MFEQEISVIIAAVRTRVAPAGGDPPAVYLRDILAANIPSPLKAFFRADVESMLAEELHRHRKTSRFSFEHPEAQSLQQQMNSVLVMNFGFEPKEFDRRLEDAVHLIVNFLVRPQWTLAEVLFEKERSVSTAELTRMMRFFAPYEYLRELVARYVEDVRSEALTRPEFAGIIWKLDAEYIRRKSGGELARLMSPLFDFREFPRSTGAPSLPVKALIKFFEDKGILAVLQRLEGELAQGRSDLSLRELGEILEEVRRASGPFEAEQVQGGPEQGAAPSAEPFSSAGQVSAPSATAAAARVPATGASPPSGHAPAAAPAPGRASAASPSQGTAASLRPVLELIEDGDRKRFMKKIFKQDESAFDASVRSLDAIAQWKQASVFIDEIFIRNDVDPYSTEAKRFLEIVYQRYYPKE